MHILVIDTSQISQRILKKILADTYDLTFVSELDQAKINIARSSFETVIFSADDRLDDYLRYTYDLRRPDSPMVDRPIFLVTSQYNSDLAYRAWRAGINRSFAKPLQAEHFLAVIAQQFANPILEAVPRQGCSVELVSWIKGGIHYLYSPDLDRLVTAATPEGADAQMNDLLEQSWYDFEESRYGEARVHVKRRQIVFKDWQSDERLMFNSISSSSLPTLAGPGVPAGRPAVDPDKPPSE